MSLSPGIVPNPSSTSLSPEIVPDPSSVYNASPCNTPGHYSCPNSMMYNYNAYSPIPSYVPPPSYMPPSSVLNCPGYGMPGLPVPLSSSHPSFSSFHIMSPMYAHSIDMSQCHTKYQSDDISQGNPVFTLQWLTGKIRKCYGCANNIRADASVAPKPPYDIVVRYREQRYYRDTSTQMLKLTKNEEKTYYHPMQKCIKMKHPSFNPSQLDIPTDLAHALLPVHKSHLLDNFGIHT